MNGTYTVYMHENIINHKKYIGITKRSPKLRWQNGTAYKNNKHFNAAIQKYGWDNFNHIILESDLSYDEACNKEQEYIQIYNTINPMNGYNQTLGGEGISGYQFTSEQRERMSDNNKGKNNPMYGRRGDKHPLYGKKGELSPMFGRHHSVEARKKISQKKKGKSWTDKQRIIYLQHIKSGADNKKARAVKQLNLEGEILNIFQCINDITRQYGFDASNIVKVCKGKQKTAYGYNWEYCD